jgi:hypothetical protein
MPRAKEAPANRWFLPGLGAPGPDASLKEKLNLFGQFVGDWDIDWRWVEPDGSERRRKGRLYFRWILNGRAVQDIWSAIEGDPPWERPIGTTIRFPNIGADTWTSVWIAPDRGLLRRFVARKMGEEIVLATTKDDGNPEHWIFSEITAESFRWRAEESFDGGRTWKLTEEMHIRRIPRTAGA